MAELTQKEAETIRADLNNLSDAKESLEHIRERYPDIDLASLKSKVDTISARIRQTAHLSTDQSIDDIVEDVFYIVNTPSMESRHITVDELPKVRIDKRNGYPDYYKKANKRPGRIPKKTRAKRAAALVKKMVDGRWDDRKRECVYSGDAITHIESGRVWDAASGATADEFLEAMK